MDGTRAGVGEIARSGAGASDARGPEVGYGDPLEGEKTHAATGEAPTAKETTGNRDGPRSGSDVYDDLRFHGLFPRFQAVGQAAGPCRVSLLICVLGILVLQIPDQMAEALTALSERREALVTAGLVAASMGWGFTSWYFARQMLRFAYPNRRDLPERVRATYHWTAVWLPRFLGIAPPVATSIALFRCLGRTDAVAAPAAWLLVLSLAFGGFVVVRRPFLEWLRQLLLRRSRKTKGPRLLELSDSGEATTARRGVIARLRASIWEDLGELYEPNNRRLGSLPLITKVLLGVHVFGFVLLTALFVGWPVPIAPSIGAPTVLLLALSSWIVAGSAIAYLSSWLRLPLALILVLWAIGISRCNDDHVAPTLGKTARYEAPKDVAADFDDWQKATGASPGAPYIVVATEGGGIRAAYWTAVLLAALKERYPRFEQHVYAISSVSGGSLGAAVFTTLAHKVAPDQIRDMAGAILSDDALAPPLAKLLFPELLQGVWPLPIRAFDRGTALEQAWAQSIRNRIAEDPFDAPFDPIWRNDPTLPRLFLNATSVETGQRVVFSHPIPPADCDIVDGQARGAFSLAQVVHDSARFPYISPAATILGPLGPWQHVVDGGYFENSGTATARDIVGAVSKRGKPHVLVIRYVGGEKEPEPLEWATDLVAPPVALFQARDARATQARATLEIERIPHVELRLHPENPPLPLGWMLSAGARQRIDHQVKVTVESSEAHLVDEWLQ